MSTQTDYHNNLNNNKRRKGYQTSRQKDGENFRKILHAIGIVTRRREHEKAAGLLQVAAVRHMDPDIPPAITRNQTLCDQANKMKDTLFCAGDLTSVQSILIKFLQSLFK